ncbi:hypothetical protein DFH08DRAFT_827386 [Mycena albidolilacea]|uniref:Uncharacterized protein n=1 Tax=Mycena albidolilacea TaxID=1033008 RepID=A0AAD7E866_9AGAR|nr:hypothetical protein DFH08DRAFT_827386 [Mycena albidolilacea]
MDNIPKTNRDLNVDQPRCGEDSHSAQSTNWQEFVLRAGSGQRKIEVNDSEIMQNKLVGLGERLRSKLDRATKEYGDQIKSFTAFSTQQAVRIPAWKKKVKDFERDGTKENPYQMVKQETDNGWAGATEAEVLLAFEKEEAERVRLGVPSIHSVSAASFIAAWLEVEDDSGAQEKRDDCARNRCPGFAPQAQSQHPALAEPASSAHPDLFKIGVSLGIVTESSQSDNAVTEKLVVPNIREPLDVSLQ